MEYRAITVSVPVRIKELAGVRIPYPGFLNLLDYVSLDDIKSSMLDGELNTLLASNLIYLRDENGSDLSVGQGLIDIKYDTYGNITPDRMSPIVHTQTIPAVNVIIVHNLGRIPHVEITDLFGAKIQVYWEKRDNNRIEVMPGIATSFIASLY
jgi:hypothetical protein